MEALGLGAAALPSINRKKYIIRQIPYEIMLRTIR
jgi:hypothetical protein